MCDVMQLIHDRIQHPVDRRKFRQCFPFVCRRLFDQVTCPILDMVKANCMDEEHALFGEGCPLVKCTVYSSDMACELTLETSACSMKQDLAHYRLICRAVAKLFPSELAHFYVRFPGIRDNTVQYLYGETVVLKAGFNIITDGSMTGHAVAITQLLPKHHCCLADQKSTLQKSLLHL